MINAETKSVETATLFERLGRTEGITAIVDDVIEAHINNPAINVRFLPYVDQPERFAKIQEAHYRFF